MINLIQLLAVSTFILAATAQQSGYNMPMRSMYRAPFMGNAIMPGAYGMDAGVCRCDHERDLRLTMEVGGPRAVPGRYNKDFQNNTGFWFIVEDTYGMFKCPIYATIRLSDTATATTSRLPDATTCDVTISNTLNCYVNDSVWVNHDPVTGEPIVVTVIDSNYDTCIPYVLVHLYHVGTGSQDMIILARQPNLDPEVIRGLHLRLIDLGLGYLEVRLVTTPQTQCCKDNCNVNTCGPTPRVMNYPRV